MIATSQGRNKLIDVCALIYGTVMLLPQPCLPIGGYNALQLGHLILGVSLIVGLGRISPRVWALWLGLVFPYAFSGFVHLLFLGDSDGGEVAKIVFTRVFEMLPFLGAGVFLRNPGPFLAGIIAGISLELLLVMYQALCFLNGYYPQFLFDLQNNPQYGLTVQSAKTFVMEFRANGLMPESSALWSAISPLLFILLSTLLVPSQAVLNPTSRRKAAIIVMFLVGLFLALTSRSGYILFFGIATVVVLIGVMLRNRTRKRIRFIMLLACSLVSMSLVGIYAVQERMEADLVTHNHSWAKRADAIQVGLESWANGDTKEIFWGFMSNAAHAERSVVDIRFVASVVVKDITRLGVGGVAMWLVITTVSLRSITRSRNRVGGLAVFIALFSGMAGVTGYTSLMPFACTLCFVLNWHVLWPVGDGQRRIPTQLYCRKGSTEELMNYRKTFA